MQQPSSIRVATLDDVALIQSVAVRLVRELGYLDRGQIKSSIAVGEILICPDTGSFVRFHKRRDKVTVIYCIAVPIKHRSKGIGRKLIDALDLPVRLKCILGLPANEFYRKCGFKNVGTEKSSKSQLLIWEKQS